MRIALGLLLRIAAALKLAGQHVSAVPQVGWFATPTIQIAAAEWEIVLGIWLLRGAYRIGAWMAALGTFVTFAGVSGYLGWIGVSSCGCFGAINASPWHAFAVDVIALAALTTIHPSLAPLRDMTRQEARLLAFKCAGIGLAIAGAIAGVSGAATLAYGGTEAALARLRGEHVSVVPSMVDFGAGGPSEVREQAFELVNRTDRTVRIIGTNASCSCKMRERLPVYLPPNEAITVGLRLGFPNTPSSSFARRILLMTDDDMQPLVVVRCYGKVNQP